MEIRKKLDDAESRKFWEFAQTISREVEAWPAWKRGEFIELKGESGSDELPGTASTPEKSSCD